MTTVQAIEYGTSRVKALGAEEALEGVGVQLGDDEISRLRPALAALVEGSTVGQAVGDALAVGITAGLAVAGYVGVG